MPDSNNFSSRAMFDVKPVDQSGSLDLQKINLVEQKLSLKTKPVVRLTKLTSGIKSISDIKLLPENRISPNDVRQDLINDLNKELKKKSSLQTVLTKVGGSFYGGPNLDIKRRPLVIRQTKKEEKGITLPKSEFVSLPRLLKNNVSASEPKVRLTAASPSAEIDTWLEQVKKKTIPPIFIKSEKSLFIRPAILIAGVIAISLALVFLFNKDRFREKVAQDGNKAVANLESAKADIEKLDFISAAKNFNLAQHNFSSASDRLNLLSSAFTSFLGGIPGLGKLKSAQNLVAAGENIAQAGESLSLAADQLSQTNFVSYFGLTGQPRQPLTDFLKSFRESLVFAQTKFGLAASLVAEVDPQVIPEEKREVFVNFKDNLPLFTEFLSGALDYSDFLLELIGQSGPKKYLVLFQNNAELRPTGGFIGSYALVDFNRGFLRNLEVKNVYETDGQAQKNIVPPKELQHITPTWGMRDANWFINFPDSAKKVMQMYSENDGQPAVDGVITLTPTIISKILAITGPVELPEYGIALGSDNFVAEIQEEVEYGENREEPKQILIDFVPKFLEELGGLDKEKWAEIFEILSEGVEQKHVLAYFKDQKMEKTALAGGFGGEIKKAAQDYLSVVHTNVKGSKGDAVTENSYILKSDWKDEQMEHSLSIIRKHRGGKSDLGFYNRTNYDYVRVLVPAGSKLLEINGHSSVKFSPLVEYNNGDFVTDPDLAEYEKKAVSVKSGVKQWEEGGKTVFGFWLKVEPGKTEKVVLKYQTPMWIQNNAYSLLVQKQPGTLDDFFSFSLDLPKDKQIIYKNHDLTLSGNSANFQTKLLKDTEIEIKFQ
ncbi:MAG: hypothetical protein A3I92_00095 [Candidatus Yanofskybacteria bacterium RIFCSPLOWO2_02_FULL_43_10b]|uniref:DUF4012 domain-containing protein n=1 Tax=Candidatus Yanofskybacteria bacterium RIFCSPLOWO2_02_FULL_43_10b TaxID=1802704 RepID=A0A1F8H514_9BACT|nr:MAG: hypothetical protein A3I92_00095 [Candidatus Yanofskybacteria bacterium RIFCSPLOWO2_02_FULL_43_10b]